MIRDNMTPEDELDACRELGIDDWICRARYSYTGHPDNAPILLNEGTRWEGPFTVRDAMTWTERLAVEMLA